MIECNAIRPKRIDVPGGSQIGSAALRRRATI
jgi:hypothetical protein